MSQENCLTIHPFRKPARGHARIPGSKSITNRALILAYLSADPVQLRNPLRSEDTEAMLTAMRSLGVKVDVETSTKTLTVWGCGGNPPQTEALIDVKNAGTVARFLPAALCLRNGGSYTMDGTAAMRERPMRGLLDALSSVGPNRIEYQGKAGHYPFVVHTGSWNEPTVTVDASGSSQILSALLLASTRAPHSMKIRLRGPTVSLPFLDMTIRMIHSFGGNARKVDESTYEVEPGLTGPDNGLYPIEPDASAASYFFALPLAVGGEIRIEDFPENSLQGDLAFLDVLPRAGVGVTRSKGVVLACQDENPDGNPIEENFNAFSDTFLTLAALSPLLPVPVQIKGIGHTRHQETDRIHAMATELRKLGQDVAEGEDWLHINGSRENLRKATAKQPVAIETYRDHRVAMSFAILGCHDLHGDGRPWIQVLDPRCADKTFPDFFEELARLRTLADGAPQSL